MKAKSNIKENVQYKVVGRDGKEKYLFQTWGWVTKLIKRGILSPLHPKLPIVFGYWSKSLNFSNLVTNGGMSSVAALMSGVVATNVFQYIALGTGTNAAAATDTGLQTEIGDAGLTRGTATMSLVTTDVAFDTLQAVFSFSVTGTKAVTESGLFNRGLPTSNASTMLARQVFSAINVVSGDTLQITWKIDVDTA